MHSERHSSEALLIDHLMRKAISMHSERHSSEALLVAPLMREAISMHSERHTEALLVAHLASLYLARLGHLTRLHRRAILVTATEQVARLVAHLMREAISMHSEPFSSQPRNR